MEGVYLCSEYLESHPLFKSYGSSLTELAERDYPGEGIFRGYEIPTIDLDTFEKDKETSRDCTSDGVIGVADAKDSHLRNRRLLLTELRLGYENQKNLHFSNILKKYQHSCDILREEAEDVRIDSEFALIFTVSLCPRANRWIRSWATESSKKAAENWKAYSPESFCNYINYGKGIPLKPSEETISTVSNLCAQANIGFNELYGLKEKIEYYWYSIKGKNLSVDMEYFSERISNYLHSVSFPDGEEREYCELLKEEILEIILIKR